MRMVNVTEVRVNIRQILGEMARSKEPVVILQRSRPAAYLIDPETFERLQRPPDLDFLMHRRMDTIEEVAQLREKIARERGVGGDSTPLIQALREGEGRRE